MKIYSNQDQTSFSEILKNFSFVAERMTIKKLKNLFWILLETKARKSILNSFPIHARINLYPFCNLRCVGCMGRDDYWRNNNLSNNVMSIEQYKIVIRDLSDYLLMVFLYDEGEPLLYKEICKIIEYTHKLNIATSISTNFSLDLSDLFLENLVLSGLDYLRVSVEGMTQDIYEQYRVNGNMHTVLQNIQRIIEIKNRLKKKRPVIEMQFINFGYNSHQIISAKQFAKTNGVDVIKIFPSNTEYHHKTYTGSEAKRTTLGCTEAWFSATISNNGVLFPCDYGKDKGEKALGSMFEHKFADLWNDRYMQNIRKQFTKNNRHMEFSPCKTCAKTLPFFLK